MKENTEARRIRLATARFDSMSDEDIENFIVNRLVQDYEDDKEFQEFWEIYIID